MINRLDLIVETKAYKYCYDGIFLTIISICLTEKFNIVPMHSGDTFWITRKEMRVLKDFVKEYIKNDKHIYTNVHKGNIERFIDQMHNMWMLMEKNEKVKFYFW